MNNGVMSATGALTLMVETLTCHSEVDVGPKSGVEPKGDVLSSLLQVGTRSYEIVVLRMLLL